MNLPPVCGEHLRGLARIYQSEGAPEGREAEFARALDATGSCPACLRMRWKADFDRASRAVRTDSVAVYLRDMAKLKRTFPGYPFEATPRADCRSVEEYLLKEGRAFPWAALTSGEMETVRGVLEELKRMRRDVAERLKGRHRRGRLGEIETAFVTAQQAWRASRGVLDYVEGFARHGTGSPYRFGWAREASGLRYHAWNLVNGKVVDFTSRRRAADDDEHWRWLRDLPVEACVVGMFDHETEYVGSALTRELERQFQSVPGRFWGERILFPDENTTSLREQLAQERERSESQG